VRPARASPLRRLGREGGGGQNLLAALIAIHPRKFVVKFRRYAHPLRAKPHLISINADQT
jgi:hypothetical protein